VIERKEERRISLPELAENVDCMVREMRIFRLRYEEILKETKNGYEQRRQLRKAVLEKSVIATVWAFIVFIGYAAWDYVKDHIR